MPKAFNYSNDEFDELYARAQDDFMIGRAAKPRFTEPRFAQLYQDILIHIDRVSKTLYRRICSSDAAIEWEDIQSTLYLDWYIRESGEWFRHRRTGERYKKKPYDPTSRKSFPNWLYVEGRAAVQAHLEENGHFRPVVTDAWGHRHRAQNPVLHTIPVSRLKADRNGRVEDKVFYDTNVRNGNSSAFEPETQVVKKSIFDDTFHVIEHLDNIKPRHKELLRRHLLEKESLRACRNILKLPDKESKLKSLVDSKRRIIRRRLHDMGYDKGMIEN